MNYLQTVDANTTLEPMNFGLQPMGSETSIRPLDPIEQFFATNSRDRWNALPSIPRNESSVQQVIHYVIQEGNSEDTDDAISLLATMGWPTFAVARTYQIKPTRWVKPMYVALGWEMLAQALVTADIDMGIKKQFLSDLTKSASVSVSYVAQDALDSLE